MQAESVLTLTAEAGWTMVAAIDTEAWDTSKHRFAPLLGRGNARQTRLAEHRLDETREELTQAADPELMAVALAERWAWRLADLIEERPGAEADLRALVEEIQAALPGQAVSVPHLVVAEGEMSVDVASRETSGTAVPRRHAFAARDEFPALMPVRHAALGSENAETLGARVSLASWIGEAGNPAAARDEFAALLPVCERVLGPEHPETLITRHQLANLVGYAGDAAGARDHFAALLPVRERVSGPDHPGTRTAWLNFAYWTGSAGDEARARDQYAVLLRVHEKVLGPEHPDTLATRASLAHWTADAGDPAGARDQYAALLPVRERVLGPEHPDTLATRHRLAYLTARAGDVAGACNQFAALLPVREGVLGPEHPDTAATRTSLAGLASQPVTGTSAVRGLIERVKRKFRLSIFLAHRGCASYRHGYKSRGRRLSGELLEAVV
jgi:hypothetical protein